MKNILIPTVLITLSFVPILTDIYYAGVSQERQIETYGPQLEPCDSQEPSTEKPDSLTWKATSSCQWVMP